MNGFGVNRIAFTGIASGLDTQAIINDLMRVKRMPLDRLHQKKQLLEWQQEDYRAINLRLDAFRRSFESLRLQGTYKVSKAVSDNDQILSVTARGTPTQSIYSVEVVQLAKAAEYASVTLQTKVNNEKQSFSEAGLTGNYSFQVNGVTISVDGNTTLESLVSSINTNVQGVKAEIYNHNQLIVKSVATGQDETIQLSQIDPDLARFFGLVDGSDEPITQVLETGADAQQAMIRVNGVELRSNNNTFTYDNMQLTVKGTTAGSSINVTVNQDLDAMVDKIKSFVDEYNKLIEEIHNKLGEKRYRDFPPLTDEQKEAMSEKEIEKWEERARSGLLNHDPILQKLTNALRIDLYSPVEGVGSLKHLTEIGITVGKSGPNSKYTYMENGKLYLDEGKLREALSENADDVIKLLTNRSNATDPSTKYKETGVFARMFDLKGTVDRTISELNTKAGLPSSLSLADNSTIAKNIRDINEDIDKLERRLMMMEERYWRQFTAMEKALARLQNQGAWLNQQISGMM